MKVSDLLSVATCVNCSRLVTVTDIAVFHTESGTVSCNPIRCVDPEHGDSFHEPPDAWTGPRAEV
jgi:hypothetical protein